MSRGLRRLAIHAAYRALHGTGAARWHRRADAVVFCYHNVVPDELVGRAGNPWIHAGISEFSEQIEWISKHFAVVPLGELLSRLRRGRPLKGLAAVTFDDGYTGCLRLALPVMRRVSVPFTLFPVIRAADQQTPFWWDVFGEVENAERQRYLTSLMGDSELIAAERPRNAELPEDAMPASWSALRSALGDDCTIGIHGMTHRNLTALSPAEVAWEVTEARARLNDEIGRTMDVVAYPYGLTNAAVQAETERAGCRVGLGLDFGLIRDGDSTMNLSRITVPAGLSMSTFACWASGLQLRG